LGVRDLPGVELIGRLAGAIGVAGLGIAFDPEAVFKGAPEPGVVGAARFIPGAIKPIREGVIALGLLPLPTEGESRFPALLVFKEAPGDLGAMRAEPGDGNLTPVFAPETTLGERAIIAPRDAAAAGDRERLRV